MIFRSPFPDISIPEMHLTEYVFSRAVELADKPAIIDGPSGRTLTYGQLLGAIQRSAAGLVAHGFQAGDVLAIMSPNIPEYAIAFHAVATAGGIVTTINPLYTAHEISQQLQDAGAKYLLTIPMFMAQATEAAAMVGIDEIFVFGEADGATPFATLMAGDHPTPKIALNAREDLVVLPYSSGTTGLSKGVMLTHYNLVSNIAQLAEADMKELAVTEEDVLIGILPFFHIYGMVVIMNYALKVGATIVTMPRFDMEQFLQLIQQHNISYAHLVPPIVLGLAKHPLVDNYAIDSLRVIFSGAAPLGEEVEVACAQRLGCIVTQGYGMTEASPVTHLNPRLPGLIKPASIGPTVPNTEAMFVDIASGKPLGPNQEGELWVRGPQVMKGYLNNPSATALTIDREGWLHTGDIGYADDDGYVYIIDRLKELIKYKGFQVAPAELEALLLGHEDVVDVAVIGIEDEEAGELPKAFVVRRGNVSEETLKQYVAERVATYKQIRYLEFVDQIPKSASGKILRRVLVEQERQKPA